MDLRLSGKVILVTGATSGIGPATTHLLAAEGARVVALARGSSAVPTLPPTTQFIRADLTDPATAAYAVSQILARHGRLDGLVNNAAALTSRPTFADIDDDQWHATFELNLHSAVRLTRAVLPVLEKNPGGGSIAYLLSPWAAQVAGAEWAIDGEALRQL